MTAGGDEVFFSVPARVAAIAALVAAHEQTTVTELFGRLLVDRAERAGLSALLEQIGKGRPQ